MTNTIPIGRLAPSPTGAQHVGNARSYLIAWLSIRARGGKIFLRIEDIDSPRIKKGATDLIYEDLRWLGLDWDEEPQVQSSHSEIYTKALKELKHRDLVYPCTCTRSDVEQAASAPHLEHEGPVYPGTCAARTARDAESLDRSFSWRFRVPLGSRQFWDGFQGQQVLNPAEMGGDFVIWKNDNTPAYQLAVVVDDARMGITEVVRGDDLIPSTPRQLMVYRAFDWISPAFYHVPLVIGTDGRRLAKRHGDTRLASLRNAGVLPEALIGLLAWSCGWINSPREISASELVSNFSWNTIPKKPFVLTEDLLSQIGYSMK